MDKTKKEKLYIDVLHASLKSKIQLLDELILITKKQRELLNQTDFSDNEFHGLIEKKEEILSKVQEFDKGFEVLYKKVADELKQYKHEYKDTILSMQGFITLIIEKGIELKNIEIQNKASLEEVLKKERGKISQFNATNKVASNYYKNMSNLQMQQSFFLDKKK